MTVSSRSISWVSGPVGLLIALEVPVVAGELHLDERRPAALPGPGDRLAGRLVHREEVEPVHDDTRHAEPGRPVGDVVAGHRPGAGRALGVAVVLGHEDGRQVPDRGQVHRLQRGALVATAVAEERDADAALALELGGQRRPADQRRAAADDPVGAEHALGQVSDVHGAALAVAAAGLAAVDLGHHLADVHAPGDAVAVPAVGAGDGVPVVEVAADADGRRLLPRVQVDKPGDLAGRELRVHPFLELADGPHRPVDVQQVLWSQSLPLNRVGHCSPPWVWWIEASRPRWALAARTAGTSTQRGPSGRSRTAGSSPGRKVSSRSPSTAMTPARASTRCTEPGCIGSISPTPTGTTRPGAIGASTCRDAPADSRAVTPCGSCRATGASWPRTLDRPIASGSAKAQNNWVTVAGSQTARAPTWRSVDTATSTSAVSVRSPARTSSSLARLVAPSAGTAPVATKPAARPAMVASRTAGNTLLVPVDRASIGTSPTADAATRAVPSPPRQTMTRVPAVTMRRTASTVSCAVCLIGWPSRNSTSGQRASWWRCRWMARNTAAEMPPRSVLRSTRCTPTAPNAVSMRWIMLAFSAVGNTEDRKS